MRKFGRRVDSDYQLADHQRPAQNFHREDLEALPPEDSESSEEYPLFDQKNPQSQEEDIEVVDIQTLQKDTPSWAWIVLAVAVFSMAAVGPTFKWLEHRGVKPLLAVSWRTQSCLLFLILPTWRDIARASPAERAKWKTKKVLGFMGIAGVGWAVSLCLWVFSLLYTTTVHASLFTSLPPIILVVYFKITGQKISSGEITGVLVSSLGVIVCVLGSIGAVVTDHGSSSSGLHIIFGDLMCFVASFFIAANTISSAKARQHVPVFLYTFSSSMFIFVSMTLSTLIFEGSDFGMSKTGLFGWASSNFLLILLAFGFIVGMIGLLSFNLAVSYVSPIVFSLVQLSDPPLSGLFAWMFAVDGVPDTYTFIGGGIVLVGIGLAAFFENARKKQLGSEQSADFGGGEVLQPPIKLVKMERLASHDATALAGAEQSKATTTTTAFVPSRSPITRTSLDSVRLTTPASERNP